MSTTKTVIQDRFELKERLFSEGNQAAYVARDKRRSEDVLLFLVPPASKLSEKADRAVRADIQRAFGVESPTLLPLLDLSEAGDYRFLVMPMPAGRNAWTRITKEKAAGGRLGHEEALRAADDLIAAARAAETEGTILGFSPKQVWIDADGSAEVQYYWLERVYLHDEEFAAEGAGIKTLGVEGGYFQAPELSAGRAGAAAPADQFFIGAILYGLLTGEVPGGTLAPIRRSRSDVPKPFAAAVERALAQDPAKRHPDFESFRRALYKTPAKLGHLVPLLLLLLGLWAGFALFLGGADLDDWAFPAEMEARREAAFLASRPTAEPVPEADEETLRAMRGSYRTASDATKPPEFALRLAGDGTFLLTDRSRDEERRAHGLWWREAGGTALVLQQVGVDARRGRPLRAEPADGGLRVTPADGQPRDLRKTGWETKPGQPPAPLIRLDEPLLGSVHDDVPVRVAGRVALADTTVTVQGESVPVVGTKFDTVVSLPETGLARIVIEATAPDGFTQTLERTVYRDETAPRIEATARLSESAGVWTLHVEGSCRDDGALAAITINGDAVKPEKDGSFAFERQGTAALRYAFVEIVALDEAGRSSRRLLWATVAPTDGKALEPLFEQASAAFAEDRTDEAEDILREIRAQGGHIEQLPTEEVSKLAYGARAPVVFVDPPPAYFENDGTQMITLTGRVEEFAPGDKLMVRGQPVDVGEGGRFEARVQVPKLGLNKIPVQVDRRSKAFAKQEVDVRLAAPDGDVPEWTGRPVSEVQRAESARLGVPIGRTNKHGMRFVLVPAGSFYRTDDDGERFAVTISKAYYMQVTEVTRDVFEKVTGTRLPTSYETKSGVLLPVAGTNRPAAGMTREAAMAFARTLSGEDGTYRLPTEAEWEHAGRAGDLTNTNYWGGDTSDLATWGNFADLSIRDKAPRWPDRLLVPGVNDGHPGTWAVGRGRSNGFGLRDMLGNVAEWTADYFAPYDRYDRDDPRGPASGRRGVIRGGSFAKTPDEECLAARDAVDLDAAPRADVGFRLVLEVEAP